MICDNEPFAVEALADRLRSDGFEVEITTHPQACLNRARQERFDLFILDMHLGFNLPPGLRNGLELAQELWKLESAVNVPIVGITGVTLEVRQEALDLGLVNFVLKPLDPAKEVPKLLEILKSRSEAREAMADWLEKSAGQHWNVLDLRVARDGVRVQSNLVAGQGPLSLPESEYRLALRVLGHGVSDEEFFEGLGTKLQQSLCPTQVIVAFHQQRLLSQLAQRPFRVLLHFEDPAWTRFPWELCRYSGGTDSGHWLGGDPQLTCARVPPNSGRLLEDESLSLPLKVLVVGAQPPGVPALELSKELAELKTALQPLRGRVQWHVLGLSLPPAGQASPATINEEISRFRPNLIHFMGHGTSGRLLLEQQQALTTWSDYFLNLDLAGQGVRLLVLNCCFSGHPGEVSPGLAAAGANAGVKAVIGHFFPVSDPAATQFTRVFYGNLVRGDVLDKAFQEARRQVASEELRHHRPFLPVLWIRDRFFKLAV